MLLILFIELNNFRAKIQQKIANCKKETEFFINNHVCPTCTQDISQEFRDQKIVEGDNELLSLEKGFTELETEIQKEEQREAEFMVLSEQIVEINSLITQLIFFNADKIFFDNCLVPKVAYFVHFMSSPPATATI